MVVFLALSPRVKESALVDAKASLSIGTAIAYMIFLIRTMNLGASLQHNRKTSQADAGLQHELEVPLIKL
jgi:hypothetical protein